MTHEQIAKLADVATHIFENPDQLDMDSWCGSTCCVAGHLLLREGMSRRDLKENVISIQTRAAEIIGLTREQGKPLFHLDSWPDEFSERYDSADGNEAGNKQRAEATYDRIWNFIDLHLQLTDLGGYK